MDICAAGGHGDLDEAGGGVSVGLGFKRFLEVDRLDRRYLGGGIGGGVSVGDGEHSVKLRGSPGVHNGPLDGLQAVVGDERSGAVWIIKLSSFKYTNIGEKQHRERRTNANLRFDPAANFKVPFV